MASVGLAPARRPLGGAAASAAGLGDAGLATSAIPARGLAIAASGEGVVRLRFLLRGVSSLIADL